MATKNTKKVEKEEDTLIRDTNHNNMMYAVIGSIAILSLSLVSSAYLISTRDNYIKNIGNETTQDGKIVNTISVTGNGEITASPDMATVRISINKTKDTTEEALEAANEDINSVKYILKGNGVREEDIKTENLNTYPEYDWSGGERELKGQRASQTLSFEVKGLDKDASEVSKIIDGISEIDGIVISSVSFGIEDEDSYISQAREEAYKNAEAKAKQIAELGDLELTKPVSISEPNISYNYPVYDGYYLNGNYDKAEVSSDTTDISSGETEINASLDVVFGIE